MIGEGKHKNKLAVTNTLQYWYRYKKTKIKNTFKESLNSWIIPECDKAPNKCGVIEFQLYRPNERGLDADSISVSTGKWIMDFIVEQGWFSDDDKMTFVYKPKIVDKSLSVTEVHVKVYETDGQ